MLGESWGAQVQRREGQAQGLVRCVLGPYAEDARDRGAPCWLRAAHARSTEEVDRSGHPNLNLRPTALRPPSQTHAMGCPFAARAALARPRGGDVCVCSACAAAAAMASPLASTAVG